MATRQWERWKQSQSLTVSPTHPETLVECILHKVRQPRFTTGSVQHLSRPGFLGQLHGVSWELGGLGLQCPLIHLRWGRPGFSLEGWRSGVSQVGVEALPG